METNEASRKILSPSLTATLTCASQVTAVLPLDSRPTLNCSEFAITQVNEVLEICGLTRPECSLDSGGMNSCSTYGADIRDHRMVCGVWRKALELTISMMKQGNSPRTIDFIINDLGLKPNHRKLLKDRFGSLFPKGMRDQAERMGFTYCPRDKQEVLQSADGSRIPVRFVFESFLRNRAKKMLKKMLHNKRVELDEGGCFFRISSGIMSLFSNSGFSAENGSKLYLSNRNGVPMCAGIVLAYYSLCRGGPIVNLQDFSWRCGYRQGALAHLHMANPAEMIVNLFYASTSDETLLFDAFLPSGGSSVDPMHFLSLI